ncbi:hypothetical protein M0802_014943 [Mischocyttarus mexicanus]|nr:hypothetical protein M0802_014954 [Mischocyttarus mexicanus]KAI4476038.1 hypothetical protein M0802_014943 [Mischocyttarus mexicanus]
MSILKFRESIINKLLKDEEIPQTQIITEKKHVMEKFVGLAVNTRKRCRECYRKLSQEKGSSIAAIKAKRVTTFWGACEDQPPLCLPCFNKTNENK